MASFRIPYPSEPAQPRNLDKQQWGVLLNSIFPGAESAEAILNAWDLAKVRGLDVFSGHVAIVSQRRKVDGQWVDEESCWLTLKALVFTAHHTSAFAGIDPITFGPIVERTYTGVRRTRGEANEKISVSVNVPEHVTATVYRFVAGQRCAFSETLFFDEAVPQTGPDQGQGAKYLILPPGSQDMNPEGYIVVQSPTNQVWFDSRGLDPDKVAAEATLRQHRLYAWADRDVPPETPFVPVGGKDWQSAQPTDLSYWQYLSDLFANEPVEERDRMMFAMLRLTLPPPPNPV